MNIEGHIYILNCSKEMAEVDTTKGKIRSACEKCRIMTTYYSVKYFAVTKMCGVDKYSSSLINLKSVKISTTGNLPMHHMERGM